MSGVALLRPWWLIAGAAAVALLWWHLSRPRRTGDWGRVIDPHLLAALSGMGGSVGAARLPWRQPLLWCVGLLCLALSGPSVAVRDARAFRNLDGAVFVLDISLSMTEGAAWSSIVTAARAALISLGSRPAALVVYGGDAYLASELTTDLEQIGFTLSLIDGATMPDPGSRPALGLALAAETLADAGIVAGDVVWMTDGGGVDASLAPVLDRIDDLGGHLTVVATRDMPGPAAAMVERLTGAAPRAAEDTEGLAARLSAEGIAARLGAIDIALLGRADLGRYLVLPVLLLFASRMRRPG